MVSAVTTDPYSPPLVLRSSSVVPFLPCNVHYKAFVTFVSSVKDIEKKMGGEGPDMNTTSYGTQKAEEWQTFSSLEASTQTRKASAAL